MQGRTLFDNLIGHRVSMDSLNSRSQKEWVSLMGHGPIIHFLSHSWLSFIFHSKEYALHIFIGCWFMDNTFLTIKLWHLLFDAWEEFSSSTLVWIKLPRLPIEFCLEPMLKEIGFYPL